MSQSMSKSYFLRSTLLAFVACSSTLSLAPLPAHAGSTRQPAAFAPAAPAAAPAATLTPMDGRPGVGRGDTSLKKYNLEFDCNVSGSGFSTTVQIYSGGSLIGTVVVSGWCYDGSMIM